MTPIVRPPPPGTRATTDYRLAEYPAHTQRKAQAALARLDPDQARSAQAIRASQGGTLRIAATAGSGKTTSLIATLAALIVLDGVDPRDICAVTFTNKAGSELRERLAAIVGTVPKGLRMGTFHALALTRLREGDKDGGWDNTRNLDTARFDSAIPSQKEMWESVIDWRRGGVHGSGERSLSLDADWMDYALVVDQLRGSGLRVNDDPRTVQQACAKKDLAQLYTAWKLFADGKAQLGVWDFADALDAYLDRVNDGREAWAPKYVVVDEAQDNNRVQLNIAMALRGKSDGTLVLVGDGSQSIYEWRGATPEVFCQADTLIPGTKTTTLPNNYRSAPAIVALGNRVGAALGEEWTAGLVARPQRSAVDGIAPIGALVGKDPLMTAYLAADAIDKAIKSGGRPDDFAILIRTNNAAALYEGALMARGIPCVRWGGQPFWERHDVLGFVGYTLLAEGGVGGLVDDVTLVQNNGAFRRIVNQPLRYLSRAWTDAVVERVVQGAPLVEAICDERRGLKQKSQVRARDLAKFIERIQGHSWDHSLSLIRSKMIEGMPSDKGKQPDAEKRAVPATCAGIAKREYCGGVPMSNGLQFARYADAGARNAERAKGQIPAGRVVLSTIHRFKGLERPRVIIPMEEGLLPHKDCVDDKHRYGEEQRLFYVAVTRGRDQVLVTCSRSDLDGKPLGVSDFASFLPKDVRDHIATAMAVDDYDGEGYEE
jgi:superfamily I DNA/RNA helicase